MLGRRLFRRRGGDRLSCRIDSSERVAILAATRRAIASKSRAIASAYRRSAPDSLGPAEHRFDLLGQFERKRSFAGEHVEKRARRHSQETSGVADRKSMPIQDVMADELPGMLPSHGALRSNSRRHHGRMAAT